MDTFVKLSQDLVEKFAQHIATKEVEQIIAETRSADDSDLGTFEVIITSEAVDRYGEVVKADGIDTENYLKNPVVLWGHSHFTLPIGVCTEIWQDGSKTYARGRFAAHEFAQDIRKLYDMGIVRATSIGFIVKEMEGPLITKCELIEFSFVSVPANPEALSTIAKSVINLNEMIVKGIIKFRENEETVVVEKKEDSEEQKAFSVEKAVALRGILSETIVALDAVIQKDAPQERDEETQEDSEASKALDSFNQGRRFMQLAATHLSESLAAMRREMTTRK